MNEDDAFAGEILDFPRKEIRNSAPRSGIREIGFEVLVPRQRTPTDVDDARIRVGNDSRHRGADPAGATGNENEVCNHCRSVGNPVRPGTRARLVREGSEQDNLYRCARAVALGCLERPFPSRLNATPTADAMCNEDPSP